MNGKERRKVMKAEIVVILDRSGSMCSIADDAIGGFNEFIRTQKEVEGEATVTLIQFDDKYEKVFGDVPLQDVQQLTRETFVPRGMTALHDAIGRTITNIRDKQYRNSCPNCKCDTKTIFAILTDGAENASREFDQAKVNELISHQRDEHKWEFIFLAANQDAFATGMGLGINAGDTFNFVADKVGTRNAYIDMSNTVMSYRSMEDDSK
jgi:uncharacterized protein YegL